MAEFDETLMDEWLYFFPGHVNDDQLIDNGALEHQDLDFDIVLQEPFLNSGGDSTKFTNGNLGLSKPEMSTDDPWSTFDVGGGLQSQPMMPMADNLSDLQNVSWTAVSEANAAFDNNLHLRQNTPIQEGHLSFVPRMYEHSLDLPVETASLEPEFQAQFEDQPDSFENLPVIQTLENRAQFGSSFTYDPPHYASSTPALSNPYHLPSQSNRSSNSYERDILLKVTTNFHFPEEGNLPRKKSFEMPNGIEEQEATSRQGTRADIGHSSDLKVRKKR
jgi:hypothetical protein